jgi:Fe2+ or Zn2+ uptake regulation protein
MATEHDHLAQAIRHIARAEEMVTEQRDLITRMAQDGHDTTLAENLLHIMQNTLNQMYEHRALIEAAIAAGRR